MIDSDSDQEERIRLWVIAPSLALRTGLRAMLAAGDHLVIVGESSTLSGLEGAAAGCDVIVIDHTVIQPALDDETGLQAESPLRIALEKALARSEVYPALLLLGDDPREISTMVELPVRAWGVLPLDSSADEMIAAVHALHEGLLVSAPHLLSSWLQAAGPLMAGGAPNLPQGFEPSGLRAGPGLQSSAMPSTFALTPRETEVLQFLAQGLANKQIALALGISEHTIKFHVSSIYSKLGVGNRTEAVRVGARQGLILL